MQQKTLSLAIAALLPTAITSTALAQTTVAQTTVAQTTVAPEGTTVLDTVVVESVYAVPADKDNTGSAVTVLTEEDFADRDATYLVDVLKTVPGMAVGTTGGHGAQTSVFLRGADSGQTLVVIDGVKMNPATGLGFDFGTLPLSHIERVEVLRGEQSALWGSHAVGGVINIVTKSGKNANKPFNADVNIGGGSNGTSDLAATLYGRQGGLYYAINAATHHTDGISTLSRNAFTYTTQSGTTVSTGGAKEDDTFRRGSLGLRLGYEFENAGIEVQATHNSYTVHFDPTSLSTEATADPHTTTDENIWKISGYLGGHEDLIRQSAHLSGFHNKSETWSRFPSDNRGRKLDAAYQIDVNFDREGAIQQAVTGLLEYQKNSLITDSYQEYKDIEQKSAVLEYRLFSEDDHALSVGLRYDDNSEFDNALTYRIAGGFRLNDNFRLHASVGTGIKNPTMYDYYGYYGTYQPNFDLKPEKSRGGDIGLTVDSGDANHRLDITYFNRNIEDLISDNASYDQSINIDGRSKASGIELSYRGNITDQLSAYANYTYTKTESPSGKQLVRRPKHQASIGVDYQINEQWAANANVIYVGERLNNYFDSTNYQLLAVDMPDYTVVNVGANYQFAKHWQVYANINNLFDKEYENVVGYGQSERGFYIGIKGRW